MRSRNPSLLIGALAVGLAAGCAASVQVAPEEVAQIQSRLAELERQQGRMRVRMEDTEGRVYLLQDRVEAQRIARLQESAAPAAPAAPVQRQGAATYSAPPPAGPARSRIPDLPVVRVGPEESAERDVEPEGPEIVITQEQFDALFGSDAQVARAPAAAAPSGPRQALPPVETGGVRLPAQGEHRPSSTADLMDLYQEALGLFHEREYQRSLDVMRRFSESNPPASHRDNALYWIGECYYGMGQYEEALGYFQRVVREFSRGNKAADSMLKVALTLERLGRADEARDVLEALVEAHPGVPSAQRAADRLRDLN